MFQKNNSVYQCFTVLEYIISSLLLDLSVLNDGCVITCLNIMI